MALVLCVYLSCKPVKMIINLRLLLKALVDSKDVLVVSYLIDSAQVEASKYFLLPWRKDFLS